MEGTHIHAKRLTKMKQNPNNQLTPTKDMVMVFSTMALIINRQGSILKFNLSIKLADASK